MLQTYNKNDRFDWKNTGEINSKIGQWSNGSKVIGETAKDLLAGVGSTAQVLHAFEVARWSQHGVANSAEVLANIVKTVPLLPDTMIILESTAEGASGDFYNRYFGATSADDFLSNTTEVPNGSFVRVFAPWFEFEDSAMRLTQEEQDRIKNTLDAEDEYYGERELLELYGRTDEDGVLRLGTSDDGFTAYEKLHWRRWAIREECKRDKNIFDRDYPKDERTAFQKSGNQRFNATGLAMMRKRLAQRTVLTGVLEETKQRTIAFRQTPKNEAQVVVFEKPTPGFRYLLAIDPMTGETQAGSMEPDRHGAFILRAGYWDRFGKWVRIATAARIVQCRWDIDVLEISAWRLSKFYGGTSGCLTIIEMNQDRGITELLKLRGANLYRRTLFNQREQKETKAYGYQTNVKTREVLIERLAAEIREWDSPGNGIDIFDEDALAQCENFVVKPNGRSEAAEGWKDDDVFAIGLGVEVIEQATPYFPIASIHGTPPELRDTRAVARPGAYS